MQRPAQPVRLNPWHRSSAQYPERLRLWLAPQFLPTASARSRSIALAWPTEPGGKKYARQLGSSTSSWQNRFPIAHASGDRLVKYRSRRSRAPLLQQSSSRARGTSRRSCCSDRHKGCQAPTARQSCLRDAILSLTRATQAREDSRGRTAEKWLLLLRPPKEPPGPVPETSGQSAEVRDPSEAIAYTLAGPQRRQGSTGRFG